MENNTPLFKHVPYNDYEKYYFYTYYPKNRVKELYANKRNRIFENLDQSECQDILCEQFFDLINEDSDFTLCVVPPFNGDYEPKRLSIYKIANKLLGHFKNARNGIFALKRVARDTSVITDHVPKKDRKASAKNSIEASKDYDFVTNIFGRKVLLIADVLTTAANTERCRKLLSMYNPERIYTISLFKTISLSHVMPHFIFKAPNILANGFFCHETKMSKVLKKRLFKPRNTENKKLRKPVEAFDISILLSKTNMVNDIITERFNNEFIKYESVNFDNRKEYSNAIRELILKSSTAEAFTFLITDDPTDTIFESLFGIKVLLVSNDPSTRHFPIANENDLDKILRSALYPAFSPIIEGEVVQELYCGDNTFDYIKLPSKIIDKDYSALQFFCWHSNGVMTIVNYHRSHKIIDNRLTVPNPEDKYLVRGDINILKRPLFALADRSTDLEKAILTMKNIVYHLRKQNATFAICSNDPWAKVMKKTIMSWLGSYALFGEKDEELENLRSTKSSKNFYYANNPTFKIWLEPGTLYNKAKVKCEVLINIVDGKDIDKKFDNEFYDAEATINIALCGEEWKFSLRQQQDLDNIVMDTLLPTKIEAQYLMRHLLSKQEILFGDHRPEKKFKGVCELEI